jgi:predicted acyl esterase
VEKNLEAPMPDGVVLRADRYYRCQRTNLPTLLVRTPYGRSGYSLVGRLLAERGFQVVIQSCRGSDESGGEINPFRGVHEDGLATLEWLHIVWDAPQLTLTGTSEAKIRTLVRQ